MAGGLAASAASLKVDALESVRARKVGEDKVAHLEVPDEGADLNLGLDVQFRLSYHLVCSVGLVPALQAPQAKPTDLGARKEFATLGILKSYCRNLPHPSQLFVELIILIENDSVVRRRRQVLLQVEYCDAHLAQDCHVGVPCCAIADEHAIDFPAEIQVFLRRLLTVSMRVVWLFAGLPAASLRFTIFISDLELVGELEVFTQWPLDLDRDVLVHLLLSLLGKYVDLGADADEDEAALSFLVHEELVVVQEAKWERVAGE